SGRFPPRRRDRQANRRQAVRRQREGDGVAADLQAAGGDGGRHARRLVVSPDQFTGFVGAGRGLLRVG
ncbi:MAG: hypothetical protein WCK05_00705, partial [Planctomycetota bacterium]